MKKKKEQTAVCSGGSRYAVQSGIAGLCIG